MTRACFAAWVALCGWWCIACFEPAQIVSPPDGDDDAGDDHDGSVTPIDACAATDNGVACGPERYCRDQRCVANRCGDGVVAGDEQCDDGNQRLDDACTPSCRWTPSVCGDGRVGHDEVCDDGNRIDLDACSNACSARAGVDAGSGPGVADACPRVRSMRVTPFTGEPAYLQGVYFYVDAVVDGAVTFTQWTRETESLVQPPRADVFADGQEPLRVGVKCNEGPSVWAQAPDPGAVHVRLTLAAPHCPALSASTVVECPERPMGPEPSPIPGVSLECGRCVLAQCRAVDGVDVASGCFQGARGPIFQQQCQAAYVCSTHASDDCALDDAGASACYCGVGVSGDACLSNASAQGRCPREWESASGCELNDAACVLQGMQDAERAAGQAALALRCQQRECATVCP